MEPALTEWVISQGPLLATLLFELWLGYKEKPAWVFGNAHRDRLSDKDEVIKGKDMELAQAKAENLRLNLRLDKMQELTFTLLNASKESQAMLSKVLTEGNS